jgi:hypothetical protein
MLFIREQRLPRAAFLLLLFVPALGLAACGHTEAAPPAVPMDTVMQIIHAYGRGHQGTPAPALPEFPDTAEMAYGERVHSLLEQGNYAELESLAQINRSDRGRFIAGSWRNNNFFNSVVWMPSNAPLKDSDYQQQSEKLNKWQAARPDSATARIALAKFYVSYADFARGTGYADTVSSRQWKQYHARTAIAKQALIEAATLKDRDPHWYFVMECIAQNEGWEKADMRELLDQALAFEPDYYHFYRPYTNYLLPQWYGDPGEIPLFATDIASMHPEPAGSMTYFQILSGLACYCGSEIDQLKSADWQKLQLGFANVQAAYGLSNLDANRLAEMATVFHDKSVAHEAFGHVMQRDPVVWLTEDSFEQARAWANGSDN